MAGKEAWLTVKKDQQRIGIPYDTPEWIADFDVAGCHTFITELSCK